MTELDRFCRRMLSSSSLDEVFASLPSLDSRRMRRRFLLHAPPRTHLAAGCEWSFREGGLGLASDGSILS
jgi:hypothetical protein